jgi:peroxiredoxin
VPNESGTPHSGTRISYSHVVEGGDTGPSFTLTGTRDERIEVVTLPEFADGRPTRLVFSDVSAVCSAQMGEGNDVKMVTVNDYVAVSGCRSRPYSHQDFSQQHNLSYPRLTNDEKAVSEQYNTSERTGEGTRQHKRDRPRRFRPDQQTSMGGRAQLERLGDDTAV